MKRHSGQSKFAEAQAIAKDYNLAIRAPRVKPQVRTEYVVYRVMPGEGRMVYIGKRATVDGLLSLVKKAAGIELSGTDKLRDEYEIVRRAKK